MTDGEQERAFQATLSGEHQTTISGMDGTELVNVREHGREGVRMIGRSTQFGNPFLMKKDGGEYSREGCVEAYREWFEDKIRTDPEFRAAVEELRGKTLGCWCSPQACHGDVILDYLRGDE